MMASAQVAAARMKEKITAGPAKLPAARAPTEKMPAPTATARPRIIRSKTPSVRCNWRPGSSESARACSMVLVFSHCMHIRRLPRLALVTPRRWPAVLVQKCILGFLPNPRRFLAASPSLMLVLCKRRAQSLPKKTSPARKSRSLRQWPDWQCNPASN